MRERVDRCTGRKLAARETVFVENILSEYNVSLDIFNLVFLVLRIRSDQEPHACWASAILLT